MSANEFLNSLTYGNPTVELAGLLQADSYMNVYFAEITQITFPANSSTATKEELNELVDYVSEAMQDPTSLRRFQRYDKDMHNVFIHYLINKGEEKDNAIALISAVTRDVLPLITQLKFYYQRPRPAQLAYYHKLQLFPYKSTTADSPAYPSGHAIQAKLFANIIGNKYPQLNKEVQSLAADIILSRLYLGQNYRSSLDFGVVIADKVINNKELCVKYGI